MANVQYYKKKKDIPSEELLKSEDCSKNHVEELGKEPSYLGCE